jgi:hypothetical protein
VFSELRKDKDKKFYKQTCPALGHKLGSNGEALNGANFVWDDYLLTGMPLYGQFYKSQSLGIDWSTKKLGF